MSHKWIGAAVIGLLLLVGVPWALKQTKSEPPVVSSTESASPRQAPIVRHPSSADAYCVAVRGNGDLAPAHWGGVARVFETYGAPAGMAGGSSASMTTFLWESAIQNPLLSKDAFERGRELALLFKSLEGVTYILYEKRGWASLMEWVKQMQKAETFNPVVALSNRKSLVKHLPNAISTLKDLKDSGVFYGPSVQAVAELVFDPSITTNKAKQAALSRRAEALKQTLTVFGKFDAKNDAQLFVRNGIVDFQALARRFGAIGDFMALRGASDSTTIAMRQFFETCLPLSAGKSWIEIATAEPRCKELLGQGVEKFFSTYEFNDKGRIHDPVGKYGRSLVTTSVALGDSVKNFRKVRDSYLKNLAPGLGADITIVPTQLKFGFWGHEEDLKRIESEFKKSSNPLSALDKSQRFMNLGPGTWLQALSLSPAEPGLSPALEFSSVGLNPDWVSFGGWSDLHPVPVLKAAGCDRVVYVTRRGGDSLFSMGVVKRLLKFENPSWDFLDSSGPGAKQSARLNNNGSDDYPTSLWHFLYNLRNPQSSFGGSIGAADAVLCTDWNSFDVKTNFPGLIAEAYHSPMYENRAPAHSGYAQIKTITPADNIVDTDKGYPPFAGCIPLQ